MLKCCRFRWWFIRDVLFVVFGIVNVRCCVEMVEKFSYYGV